MQFENTLFRMGVTTFATDVVTLIPATAQTTFQGGKILSTDIGFIYGISCYADGVDPTNTALPTTTQCQNLFFLGQNGATQFLESLRLDDLLNDYAGTPVVNAQKYFRVNIPYFDLSKSVFQNPTGISSAAGNINIRLKFFYIQKDVWTKIKKEMFGKKIMQGAIEHIKQEYPNPVFDEIKYATGTGLINLTFDQQGIRAVFTHYIYWVSTAALTFTDQFGIIIFRAGLNFAGNSNGWAPIPLVRKGNILKITCSIPAVVFNVSYQKIL